MIEQRIGEYRIMHLLGNGGQGQVYMARHFETEQRVAIKFIHPREQKHAVFGWERFLAEVRILQGIHHPGVARILATDRLSDGTLYVITEHLSGTTLDQCLHRRQPALRSHWVYIAKSLAQTLFFIHEHGIVHRDLKPHNVMLQSDDMGGFDIKVMDFGMARLLKLLDGTAEEQCVDDTTVAAMTDVFDFGVMMQWMLKTAHDGSHPSLDELVLRMLSRDPSARPTMRQVYNALIPFSNLDGSLARVLLSGPHAPAASCPRIPAQRLVVDTDCHRRGGDTPADLTASILAELKREGLLQWHEPPGGEAHRCPVHYFDVKLTGHRQAVSACAVGRDGLVLLSAANDGTLKLWDTRRGVEMRTLNGPPGPVRSCIFTPDGRGALSAAADGSLQVWDLEQGTLLLSLAKHHEQVGARLITPDGRRILFTCADGTLRLWDLEKNTEHLRLIGHRGPIHDLSLSADGRYLLSAAEDRTLRIWDLSSGETLMAVRPAERVTGCALSTDGRTMLSASSDGALRIWDVPRGTVRHGWFEHQDTVTGCTMTGHHAVSVSADRTLRVWDLTTGSCRAIVKANQALRCVATSSRYLVAGDASGQVHLLMLSLSFESQSSQSARTDLPRKGIAPHMIRMSKNRLHGGLCGPMNHPAATSKTALEDTTRVFIFSAPEDASALSELQRHLAPLVAQRVLSIWHQGQVPPGEDRASVIRTHLEQASICLVLVSARLIASAEMMRQIDQVCHQGAIRTVPIIVRQADWRTTVLGQIQPLPADGRSIMRQANRDEVWNEVVTALREILGASQRTKAPTGSPHRRLTGPEDPLLRPARDLFLGREGEVQAVWDALMAQDEDPAPSVLVTGPCGCGKTEVCLSVLRRILEVSPSRPAWYVSLCGGSTASDLLVALAETLEKPWATSEREVLALIAAHSGLYYLDGIDACLEDPATLSLLGSMYATPGVQILASSRVRVAGLGRIITIDVLPEEHAVDLFRRTCAAVTDGMPEADLLLREFVGTVASPQPLSHLGRHPLAIVLAASLVDTFSVPDLVRSWKEHGTSMLRDSFAGPQHLGSLEISIGLTWSRIAASSGATFLWSLCSVLSEGMSQDAWRYFIRRGCVSEADRALLVRHHVLSLLPDTGRLCVLPPLGRFALERARRKEYGLSLTYVLAYAAEYFAHLLRRAYENRFTDVHHETMAALLCEFPAIHQHVVSDFSESTLPLDSWLHLASTLPEFCQFRMRPGREILRGLYQRLRRHATSTVLATLLWRLGELEIRFEDHEQASQHLQEALSRFEQEKHDKGRANVLHSLADLEGRLGRIDRARKYLQEAWAMLQHADDRLGCANIRCSLGELEMRSGDDESAWVHLRAALSLYETERNDLGRASALHSLADLFGASGKHEEALSHYRQALSLYAQEQSQIGQAQTLADLGRLHYARGEVDEALSKVRQADWIAFRTGVPDVEQYISNIAHEIGLRPAGDTRVNPRLWPQDRQTS